MSSEQIFTSEFLASLTVMELFVLQRDLRKIPEDWTFLNQVLKEFQRRDRCRPRPAQEGPHD